jgi:hypothetical protein
VDFAALFSRVRFSASARPVSIFPSFSTSRTGASWELPILLKYRFLRSRISPFAGFGPAFRRISMEGQNTTLNASGPPAADEVITTVSQVSEAHWQRGWAAGVGLDFRVGLLRLAPEIRYTRWQSAIPCRDCGPFTLEFLAVNPTVLMLGIGF